MTTNKQSSAAPRDGLGLGRMTGLNLAALMSPATEKYLELPLGRIREDGANPRSAFDPETLRELAETIKTRGVITPISVRPDPKTDGDYIVNHGHRRFRAARLAGLEVIPAVVDESFRDEDRIIENIQRDNLGMFEVAGYINRKLGEGLKQKDIAALIGKSTAYVNNHVQLLNLPPATAGAVDRGAVQDLTTITDLAKLEKKHPEALGTFLSERAEVTRRAAREFRDRMETPDKTPTPDAVLGRGDIVSQRPEMELGQEPEGKTGDVGRDSRQERGRRADNTGEGFDYAGHGQATPEHGPYPQTRELTSGWRRGRLIVEHSGRRAAMILERKPRDERHAWIRYEDGDREEREAALTGLKMRAVVAGY